MFKQALDVRDEMFYPTRSYFASYDYVSFVLNYYKHFEHWIKKIEFKIQVRQNSAILVAGSLPRELLLYHSTE